MGKTIATLQALITANIDDFKAKMNQADNQFKDVATTGKVSIAQIEKASKQGGEAIDKLTKEIALMGKTTRTAAVDYELLQGAFKGMLPAQAQHLRALAQQADAMEKQQAQTVQLITQFKTWGNVLVVGAVTGMVGLAKASFDASVKMETLNTALVSITGSTMAAHQELAQLEQIAKAPGLGFAETVKGALRLQGAGLSLQTSTKLITGFGNAVALAGKGKESLDLVTLALSQMAAKGRVAGDDLRQIAEQVPAIQTILKQAFGTADTQELEKAQIPIQKLMDMLGDATSRLPKMGDTLQNTLTNAADTVEKAMDRMGKAIAPVAKQLLDLAMPQIEKYSKDFAKDLYNKRAYSLNVNAQSGNFTNTEGFSAREQLEILQGAYNDARAKHMAIGTPIVERIAQLRQEIAFESDEMRRLGEVNRERIQYDRLDIASRVKAIDAAKKAIESVASAADSDKLARYLQEARALIAKVPLVGKFDDVQKDLIGSLHDAKVQDLQKLKNKEADESLQKAKDRHKALVDFVLENEKAARGHAMETRVGQAAWLGFEPGRREQLMSATDARLRQLATSTALVADEAKKGAEFWGRYTAALDPVLLKAAEVAAELKKIMAGGSATLTAVEQFDVRRRVKGTAENKLTQTAADQIRADLVKTETNEHALDRAKAVWARVNLTTDAATQAMGNLSSFLNEAAGKAADASRAAELILSDKMAELAARHADLLTPNKKISGEAEFRQSLVRQIADTLKGSGHTVDEYKNQIDAAVKAFDQNERINQAREKILKEIAEVERYSNVLASRVSAVFVNSVANIHHGFGSLLKDLKHSLEQSVEEILLDLAKIELQRVLARAFAGKLEKLLHLDMDGKLLESNAAKTEAHAIKAGAAITAGAVALGAAAKMLKDLENAGGFSGWGWGGGQDQAGGWSTVPMAKSLLGNSAVQDQLKNMLQLPGMGRYADYVAKYLPDLAAGAAAYQLSGHSYLSAAGATAGMYLGGPLGAIAGGFAGKEADKLGSWVKHHLGFRELGGPVEAGRPYIVGERRAEVFVPDRPGHILPSVPDSGDVNVNLVINGGVNNAADLHTVKRELASSIRQGLRLAIVR